MSLRSAQTTMDLPQISEEVHAAERAALLRLNELMPGNAEPGAE